MTVKIVSDISLGSPEHGNEGATFTFKILEGEKETTYSGIFKGEPTRYINYLEMLAAYTGIMTAITTLDLEKNHRIVAYVDGAPAVYELNKGKVPWAIDLRAKIQMVRAVYGVNVEIVAYPELKNQQERKAIHKIHCKCHNLSLVRFRKRFCPDLSRLGNTARTHQAMYKSTIPKGTRLWA